MKVNARIFDKRMRELSKLPNELLDSALELVKENTPAQSGYARDNTVKKGNQIISDYPYAARLDEGYSRQAPRGFTEPTIKQLQQEANKFARKI